MSITTQEQQAVIDWQGQQLVVNAFAGTGKTSTLVRYAEKHPELQMLYIAFNRSVREEAEQKFPSNVYCKTSHQLAWVTHGKYYKHRLGNSLRLNDIYRALGIDNWGLVKAVQDTLKNFMGSVDSTILMRHFPFLAEDSGLSLMREYIIELSQSLWQRMISTDDDFPVTHDVYLKLYQLSSPDLSQRFDVILFDEAQDANPVTHDFIFRHTGKLIMVGDAHQQIYRFRGAVDALNAPQLAHADRLWLTNSFRFGANIACVANALLALDDETHQVVGCGREDELHFSLPRKGYPHRAILSRTVAGVIGAALEASSNHDSVFWVNGIDAYRVDELINLHWFSLNEHKNMSSRQLFSEYENYQEYMRVAEASDDQEMIQSINIIDKFYPLPKKINAMRQYTVDEENAASVTVTTAHRAKGLEWPVVELNRDFPDILDPEIDKASRRDEINLLYVAATRARKTLIANSVIKDVIASLSPSVTE